ncbi:MAG: four helix bundle protein [Bacteroidota bacterium]
MKKNLIEEKSYLFALRIIKLFHFIRDIKHDRILASQVLRSGTSVGANIQEALGGASKKDFTCKMNIAYKEIRETDYWLRLLHDSGYIDEKSFFSIKKDCEEISKLLFTIIRTSRSKINA